MTTGATTGGDEDADACARLAAPPRPPADPELFSSNTLFGEPGIYPGASPMEPAPGSAPDADTARRALIDLGLGDAAHRFTDAELARRVPEAGPRAGLASLTGTVAESLLDAFLDGTTGVTSLGLGVPASPGRVIGPPPGATPTGVRVVNQRYRAEHPALLAPSLTHDLLWHAEGAGQYEECVLHALGAMVHVQLLARAPSLARTGTELARRQNSLAITLLNSRRPGSADVALIAPDGPGTIPGGASSMQTPDFWSIPFVSGPPTVTAAPALLEPVLAAVLAPGTVLPAPLRYDEALGAVLTDHLGRAWLPLTAQLAAARALGMLA